MGCGLLEGKRKEERENVKEEEEGEEEQVGGGGGREDFMERETVMIDSELNIEMADVLSEFIFFLINIVGRERVLAFWGWEIDKDKTQEREREVSNG